MDAWVYHTWWDCDIQNEADIMVNLKIENYFLAFILFALIIFAGVGIISDVNSNYNTSMGNEEAFNTTYTRAEKIYNDTYETSSSMKTKVADADISEDTTENSMFKGAFSAIRSSIGIFGIVGGLVNDIGSVLGIPSVFINLGISAFLIILTMTLIYLVFRFRP